MSRPNSGSRSSQSGSAWTSTVSQHRSIRIAKQTPDKVLASNSTDKRKLLGKIEDTSRYRLSGESRLRSAYAPMEQNGKPRSSPSGKPILGAYPQSKSFNESKELHPKSKVLFRQKNAVPRPSAEGYSIHRAEGMFDLSNIHNIPDHGGSIYNLMEEFKKQLNTKEAEESTQTYTQQQGE